ncbi:MAG: TdeIII family type II restriction endonuclease [Rikenellaceae bacterium]
MNNKKIERISHVLINILLSRFDSFPEDAIENRNSPFQESFLKALVSKLEGDVSRIPYFITLSSWMHGLNTTMWQKYFEKTAHILSDGEKKEYTAKKLGLLKITKLQSIKIGEIMSDLYNDSFIPDVNREEQLIYSLDRGEEVETTGFSADVFYETKDEVVAIEMKSVKPNSGEMKAEKKKILEGKTALKRLYPNKKVKFYIGFPFDPTGNGVEYDKARFASSVINLTKSFAYDEMLLSGELWDMLSGTKGTMQVLLDIINSIATLDFKDKYDYINDPLNRDTTKYKDILSSWHLYDELYVLDNIAKLTELSSNNKSLQKLLYSPLFDSRGNYKLNRVSDLRELLKTGF